MTTDGANNVTTELSIFAIKSFEDLPIDQMKHAICGELVNADTFIPSRQILGNTRFFLSCRRSTLFAVTMSMLRTPVLAQL